MHNVDQANKTLIDTNKYNKTVGSRWSLFFQLLAFLLLVLDYLKS